MGYQQRNRKWVYNEKIDKNQIVDEGVYEATIRQKDGAIDIIKEKAFYE